MDSKGTGGAAVRQAPLTREMIRRWIGPAVLVLIGLAGLVGSLMLGLYDGDQPGPGLWPVIVSAVIIVSGVVMGPQDDTETISRSEIRVVGSAFVLLVLFVVLFNMVGIFFPTLIVLFLWVKFLAGRGWLQSAIIAVITAGVFYLVFTMVFHVGA